ncbi:MAG: sugar phosphate isomerase/epimerase [Clostridia bacterium]|nr:sugar phosphate isomerase/epimerase [Clostridia bacterium]
MKLSITTLGCCDWSLNKVVGYFKDLGVSGIEIRGLKDTMNPLEMDCFSPENENDTKKYLKANEMKIVCLDTSCKFDNHEIAKKSIVEGKTAIDVAARFDIPFIRVFGNKIPEIGEENRDEIENLMISSLAELSDYASEKNVKVLLETHGNVCNIENIKKTVEALKEHPGFGILWDIAHSDKYYAEDIEEFYELIKPLLCHMHFKDHFRLPEHQNKLTDFGEGEIPIAKIVGILKKDGYDGYISFEHERKWNPDLPAPEIAFPKFVNYMKQFE